MMRSRDQGEDSRYREYRREVEGDRLARSLRVGCGIVAVLSTAFIPLDFAAFKQTFAPMLGFRLFCNAVMLVIIFRTARTNPLASSIIGCLATGAMLLVVIQSAGGISSQYTPGLMLLFLGMPVLLPFTASQAAFIVATLSCALGIMPYVTGESIDPKTYSLHMMFPIVAGIEAIAASALLDRLRFADFKRRREVEHARDELKVLDQEKARFTANVHHELRTPLTLMLAPVDALIAGDFGDINNLQQSYLQTVRSNGQRLHRLINNLLDLAKIEGKKYRIQRRLIDPWELIESYVESARPLAEKKLITLTLEKQSSIDANMIDPDSLERIIANLLGNALKFTNSGGHVWIVVTSQQGAGTHISVSDDGIGLAAKELQHVFDRFAQADSSSTRRYEGTGIGLALVKELVELHSGTVWVESEGPGHGSHFHVTFPFVPIEESDSDFYLNDIESDISDCREPEMSERQDGAISNPDRMLSLQSIERDVRREESVTNDVDSPEFPNTTPDAPEVLVVEDNEEMRRLLKFLLGKEFRVSVAKNGAEGLQAVRKQIPDLVLTDVMMPEMSGIELCERIKGDDSLRTIPVILVTSKAEREMKIRGLELGADDYITKPFHPAELLARAKSLVRLGTLQKEVAIKNARLQSANEELSETLVELKAASAALVQSERLAAVGELAAGIAHEVNNPVNFASNALSAIREYTADIERVSRAIARADWGDRDTQVDSIAEIRRLSEEVKIDEAADALSDLTAIVVEGLDRTQRLIADLRDFASPTRGEIESVDVGKCVESTLQLTRFSLREHGTEVSLEIPGDLLWAKGSARALGQVLLNLLKNAKESVRKNEGKISVVVRCEGAETIIEVSDNGSGIDEETRATLFKPFFSTKAAGMGTGLGLSICERIVSEMNGSIEVESVLGVGSKFSVHLPRLDDNGET